MLPYAQPPTCRTRGLLSVWHLPFDFSVIGGTARSGNSHQHNSTGHISTMQSTPQLQGSDPIEMYLYGVFFWFFCSFFGLVLNPQPVGQEDFSLSGICPLTSVIGGPARSGNSHQHNSTGHISMMQSTPQLQGSDPIEMYLYGVFFFCSFLLLYHFPKVYIQCSALIALCHFCF